MTFPPEFQGQSEARRLADILQWDIRTWSSALRYWERKVDWKNVQHCLELGGREGGLSLWLALKGKQTVCSDLENTSATASTLHQKYGVGGLIRYQDIDATKIPYQDAFDLIVFKSIIGGIGHNNQKDKQAAAFQEMYKALKPGGTLLFAENLSASPLHRYLRNKFVGWGASWRYVTLDEMKEFLQPFHSVEMHTTGFAGTFGRTEKQRSLLSVFDKLLFNHTTPSSWRYMVFGMAVK